VLLLMMMMMILGGVFSRQGSRRRMRTLQKHACLWKNSKCQKPRV
jgi:hypothetical protein